MKLYENISLKHYNTFGIEAIAQNFIEITNYSDIIEIFKSHILQNKNFYILGGGSNVLITDDYNGVVLHPTFKGIEIKEKTDVVVLLKVYAGEVWDDFVDFCVKNNFGGIENLSFIPGNCGAAPIQNIGAFGVEIKDCIESVEIFNLLTGKFITLSNPECNFGYRTSVFKNEYKKNWLIVSTTYKLSKVSHNYKTHYGNLNDELKKYEDINLQSIRQSVINIRTSKLPNPKEIGNAGSFFKNPIVTTEKASELKNKYQDAPVYPISDTEKKLAAGWLIEKSGWKGFKNGNVGVHSKQALVLVNYGNAKGNEIIDLSEKIKESVFEKFGVKLETEVNLL